MCYSLCILHTLYAVTYTTWLSQVPHRGDLVKGQLVLLFCFSEEIIQWRLLMYSTFIHFYIPDYSIQLVAWQKINLQLPPVHIYISTCRNLLLSSVLCHCKLNMLFGASVRQNNQFGNITKGFMKWLQAFLYYFLAFYRQRHNLYWKLLSHVRHMLEIWNREKKTSSSNFVFILICQPIKRTSKRNGETILF